MFSNEKKIYFYCLEMTIKRKLNKISQVRRGRKQNNEGKQQSYIFTVEGKFLLGIRSIFSSSCNDLLILYIINTNLSNIIRKQTIELWPCHIKIMKVYNFKAF